MVFKASKVFKLCLHVFLLCLFSQYAHAWWNEDWEYRKRLVLDTTSSGVQIEAPLLQPRILIRLHLGNFVYFTDLKAQGSDLRFIHSDDTTPLKYTIESIDTVAGIANIWVELPELINNQETIIYMYYGNADARSAQNVDQFWSVDDVVILQFNELAGVPKDSTAFGHHAISADVTLGVPGIIGAGVGFADTNKLLVGTSNAVDLSAGFNVSTWIKSSENSSNSHLFSLGELTVNIDNGFISVSVDEKELRSQFPLNIGQWHHVAIAHDQSTAYLLVDGQLNTSIASDISLDLDNIILGATDSQPGFIGTLDDFRLSTKFQGLDVVKFNALASREDSKLITYSEDESKAASGNNFGLIWTMLDTVRIEGWVIIGLLAILGFLSFDIIVAKAFHLKRVEHKDSLVLASLNDNVETNNTGMFNKDDHSPLSRIVSTYNTEMKEIKGNVTNGQSSAAAIEVIRSALDATLVNVSDELNRKIVFVTMAITGGPFLGLLGTVMGVMITFATISAAGDVNVRTIAPGVAAALTTTVLGLAVAIPSLFGYNYIAGRISKRITAMEVLADKLLAKAAVTFSTTNNSGE